MGSQENILVMIVWSAAAAAAALRLYNLMLLRLRMLFILAASLVCIIAPTEAYAQENATAKLQALTRSKFYSGLISNTLARIPPSVFQRCPALVSNGSSVTIRTPVSFGADGYPNAGSWKQTFPISGCGNDTILNLYFFAGVDEKINAMIGVPGTTHADPTLQRDAVRYATTGASLFVKSCNAFDVKSTNFGGYGLEKPKTPDPGPGTPTRPWWETWTLIGCGRSVDVPIDFVPDGRGTQIIQPGNVTAQ